jgi:DNA-binding response OmpR family regulator
MMTTKILIVDDEKKIVDIVKAYLEKENYLVFVAHDGAAALEMVNDANPDLIVLDLMLPKISGWDVCRQLRRNSNVPIIMLTARDEVSDKIVGLELGADDYITKPFNPSELVSRVRAILRRSISGNQIKSKIKIGHLTIDVEKRVIYYEDKIIELTATEFDIIKMLAESPGRVYSRMQILDKIQGDTYEGYERTIDSHIKNLRKKIEPNPDRPIYIITVYGVGYKMGDKIVA